MTNQDGAVGRRQLLAGSTACVLAVGVSGCGSEIVDWAGDEDAFVCPCHDGRYDHTGAVLDGPPPQPLERLPVEVRDGRVYAVRA